MGSAVTVYTNHEAGGQIPFRMFTVDENTTNTGTAGAIYPFIVIGVLVTVPGEAHVALEVRASEICDPSASELAV